MYWVVILMMVFLVVGFILTYVIDPYSILYIETRHDLDIATIKAISEVYVQSYDIVIDKPIKYRFVHYRENDKRTDDMILLGTFHEWNETYYIDISADLYNKDKLAEIVIHETRHMMVKYLNDKEIINLSDYTENIAQEENYYYNNLFDNSVYLLKTLQKTGKQRSCTPFENY